MLGALLSGLGLFVSNRPLHAWPLQLVCLIPWLWALRRSRSPRRGALLGLIVGLVHSVPLVLWLELPPIMAAALALYVSLLWSLFGALGAWLLRGPPVLAAFAVGGAAVCVEWIDVSAVPIWGTAQAFTRVWSAFPAGIQLVSLTGILGIVFVLVTAQALVVALPSSSGRRAALALALLALAVVALDYAGWTRPADRTLRVAAIGWVDETLAPSELASDQALLDGIVAPALRDAAHQGARLAVLPETAFAVDDPAPLLAEIGELAQETGLVIAVGYFARRTNDNRVAFIGPGGRLGDEYRKTHLIAFLETYQAGDGTPVVVDVAGVKVGVLVCQDDNFSDLARGLARAGAEVIAVPTRDWREVKDEHLGNARFRPVENRVGMVRAAANGISAVISGRGELVAERDHFSQGAGLVIADLPVRESGTLYRRVGDWLALAVGLLLVAAGIRAVRVGGPSRP